MSKGGEVYQECVVLISHYPWFTMLSKIAEVSLSYRKKGLRMVSVLLEAIILQPFPAPGEAIVVHFDATEHSFQRPDDQGYRGNIGVQGLNMLFSDPDFLPLFRQFHVNDVLQVLACLLGECRVS